MSIEICFDQNTSCIILDLDDMDKDNGAVRLCIILESCMMPVVRAVKFLLSGANGRVKLDGRVR